MSAADVDTGIFEELFSTWEGAVELTWEAATRCTCETPDSKQPLWGCPQCKGTGVIYAAPTRIKGLFRSQDRWLSFRREGELDHGEVQLTTPLSVKPGYVDRRVRDRFTTVAAVGDLAEGRVFLPSAPSSPFIFANVQRAWRVTVQALDEDQRLVNDGA